MKYLIGAFLAFLCVAPSVFAQSSFEPSVRYDNKNVTMLHKPGFEVIYDNDARIPIVAYYFLTPEKSIGCVARSNGFRSDPDIEPQHRSYPSDYAKQGYDLGHNVNAADMAWSKESSEASFYMSNISPQLPELNRGIFKKLETKIRDYTYESGHTIIVYVGNIWTENSPRLKNNVIIPDSTFKIILDLDDKRFSVYIMPNQREFQDLEFYETSLDDLTQQTKDKYNIPNDFEYGIVWKKSSRQEVKNSICRN